MDIENKLEAILFVSPKGLTNKKICNILGVSQDQLKNAAEKLSKSLRSRSIHLIYENNKLLLSTRKEYAPIIKTLQGDTSPPLTEAMLETLAIIAYNQPAEKEQIDQIRGVDSIYTIKSLLERSLVKKNQSGQYETTTNFLLHTGLDNLGSLPKIK